MMATSVATALWGLVRKASPAVAGELSQEIRASVDLAKKIEALRHQVWAHRWQAKKPAMVFDEVKPTVNIIPLHTAPAAR
jgi:hypothetical protein